MRAWIAAVGGSVMLALAACDYDLGPDDAVVSEDFAYRLDAAAHTGLQLLGINGSITVTGDGSAGTVSVAGVRTVRRCSPSEADRLIEALEVRVEESAETIVVRTVQPGQTQRCSLAVDYEVRVPTRFAVNIGSVNGPVRVRSLTGAASVAHVNGDVDLNGLTAPVQVLLTNGSITADAVIPGTARVDLRTVNGNVELAVPAGSSALLSASLANGVIRVDNLHLEDRVATLTMLSGTLGAGSGEIRLRTTNGNITVLGT